MSLASRSIFDWFAPPELAHADLRNSARALWLVTWPLFVVVTGMLAIAVLVEPRTLARRAITVAAVGALMILLHAISRAGRPMLASWILVLGLSLIVTERAWVTGGIFAPVAVFYALFVVMAAILMGVRGSLVTAATCVLGAIVLTVGSARAWLQVPPGAGSPITGLLLVILVVGLALLLQALLMAVPFRRPAPSLNAVEMLVHDMRSPLQVLIGHLELALDSPAESLTDVEAALTGAATLQRMTNSLLDLGRLEAGRMPVESAAADLAVLARSVVAGVRVLQPTREISVEVEGDSACHCDPELTRRVIENLVSNAMKHTKLEGRVRVVTSGSRNRAYVAVYDEGAGVPAEKKKRIFDAYSAEGLHSAATGYQSSGLGLAFCRLAVEAQGGAIRVEDGTPCGSVFVVELPR